MKRIALLVALFLPSGCLLPHTARPDPGAWQVESAAPVGPVRVEILSASADQRWDVYYDNEVVCSTPCSRWLDPTHSVVLRARDSSLPFTRPDSVTLENLGEVWHARAASLVAHPTSYGELAGGITMTTFGGMAIATAIALVSVGASQDYPRMSKAGLITFGPGVLLTSFGIWMILDARPYAKVTPLPFAQP
jgi:hypothetical protein